MTRREVDNLIPGDVVGMFDHVHVFVVTHIKMKHTTDGTPLKYVYKFKYCVHMLGLGPSSAYKGVRVWKDYENLLYQYKVIKKYKGEEEEIIL